MKILLPALILICAVSSSYSQALQIYIDAASGKTTYVSGKDTLQKPLVKRGEPINLYLENFNNYLYEVEIDEKQVQTTYYSTGVDTSQMGSGLAKSAGNSAFSMISTIMNPSGLLGLSSLAQGQLSFLGGMSFGSKGFAADEAEAMVLQQLEDWEFEYEKVLEDWARTENNLMSIQQDVERLVNAKAIQAMATEEIRKLQLNPNLSVDQVRKLSEEYLQMVFSNTPPSDIDMDYLWSVHQKGQELNLYLKNIETERDSYKTKMAEIQGIDLAISPLQAQIYSMQGQELYSKFKQSIQNSLTKGSKEVSRIDKTYEDLSSVIEELSQDDFQKLIQLRYTYEEIMANSFSYSYQTTAKEDLTELTITLNPKPDLPDNIRVSSRKLASFQVPTKGGFKVNGSVGLSFGQFFNRPQSYSVRDSIILANEEDSFVPYLSAFTHFYSHKPGQVSVGGSFGVGMPVFNTQNEQSIAFFLGPSLFLGGTQRITLTGGILGARVQTLGNGYEVGDVLDNPSLGIPTGNRYQLGYFLGVSINVVGN